MLPKPLTLINELLKTKEHAPALDKLKLSHAQAVRLLRGSVGRNEYESRRHLARIHVGLHASTHAAASFLQLCELIDASETKPDVRAKCILAVLNIIGVSDDFHELPPTPKPVLPLPDNPANNELLDVIAETLAERRRKRSMGPPPEEP